MSEATFKVCSICRQPIHFGDTYFLCNVSTCNRKRTGLFFCSVFCWDSHLPTARHRDAWAVQETAPSRAVWEASERARALATPSSGQTESAEPVGAALRSGVESPGTASTDDVLVVVSKLKKYIRDRSGMNTSDGVMEVLSDKLRALSDSAIENAALAERKTVLARDFEDSK